MSGAGDWVQSNLDAGHKISPKRQPKVTLSDFQRRACEILARAMNTGIYNVPVNWEKVVWRHGSSVRFTMYCRGLSTFDFSQLTRLVIVAHDECVRIEIQPASKDYLYIYMSPREREGDMTRRHPTIEDAIAALRG